MTTGMRYLLLLLLSLCVVQGSSAAAAVVAAQQQAVVVPDLPLGDINVVVVSDVHSWVGGHKNQDENSATYGDVISFVEHLKAYVASADSDGAAGDVWFVMNGDWIDGTGLAMNGDPSRLIPLLEKMPYDAVNVGNHELYKDAVIECMTRTGGLVEWFGKKYLSSNVMRHAAAAEGATTATATAEQPIGHRYRILRGKHANVLTFGFLYNMKNSAPSVTVQEVEAAVREDWFVTVVQNTDEYDAILVLAHMDVRDPLCQVILGAIRNITAAAAHGTNAEVPVQFITGHTHVRDYQVFDPLSTSFEPGRYLDTVGFVSFPSIKTIHKGADSSIAASEIASSLNVTQEKMDPSSLFKHQYIDANVNVLAATLGLSVSSFPTEAGEEMSEFILRVQIEMGLKQVIGCVADTYYLNRTLEARDSLWGFFRDQVVPRRFAPGSTTAIAAPAILFGNGAWRYDLFGGNVLVDDAIGVSPFNNTLWRWEGIPAEVIAALNRTLNALPPQYPSLLPNFILSLPEPFQTGRNYTLIVDEFEVGIIGEHLRAVFPNGTNVSSAVAMPGVTTTSIWLDYFGQDSHTCKAAKHVQPPHKGPSATGSSSSSAAAGLGSADPQADAMRLAFVVCAVVVMAILGSIAVYQKGTMFKQMMEQREFATLEAIREYEDDDEFAGEEGEFV